MGFNLLALFFLLVIATSATTTTPVIEPTPSTIVDILSSNVEFSYFLRILQKNGLIPIINQLQNITLLAPVNSAFTNSQLEITNDHDELMRYVLNQKFRVGWMDEKSAVFESLYTIKGKPYPVIISPNFEDEVFEVDHRATIVEPDIYAKHQWSFIQGIDAQLPLKPSMCDILLGKTNTTDITFIQSLFQSLFHQSKASLIPQSKKKHHTKPPKLPLSCEEYLNTTSTIFIPDDETVFNSMSNMTRRYYSALYHTINGNRFTSTDKSILEIKHDIVNLLDNLIFPEYISPSNTTKHHYKSKSGLEFKLAGHFNELSVNSKVNSSHMVSANDGGIYVFGNKDFFNHLNIPLVDMIPRKSLYALHYSNLVNELEFRSLEYLIDGSSSNQTILLSFDQRDDVEDNEAYVYEKDMSITGFSSKQSLMYQFIDERINITNNIGNGTFYKLADTCLCSEKKINGCFKIKLSSSNYPLESRVNDDIKIKSDALAVGNDSIAYIVDKSIDTPSNLKHSLADLLSSGAIQRHLEHIKIDQKECLKTIQYLNDFDLLALKENKLGYSAFLPCGKPFNDDVGLKTVGNWESLGLVLNYLEKNPKVFHNLLKGIFVEGTIYSDFSLSEDEDGHFQTLRGDNVIIKEGPMDDKYNHFVKINDTVVSLPLNSDILFNQGVIHIVNKLLLPADFEVSFIDLIKSTEDDGLSFLSLIEKFPLLEDFLFNSNNYSLLVPTPESMSLYNITTSMENLWEFMEMHIIPNEELPKLINCMEDQDNESLNKTSTGYLIGSNHTNLKFSCKKNKNGRVIFDVTDNSGSKLSHKIKVLSHGCVSFAEDSPCVFLIDRPINPSWLDRGFLHVHLGFVSVGIGVILGLILFSFLIFLIMFCLGGSNDKLKVPPNPFDVEAPESFMDIGSSDHGPSNWDRGYETDDENAPFMAQNGYGTIERGPPKPMSIKQKGNLHRSRNLPV
ncbi:FAS1 domain-containing protein [[Candida] jaroonii]|uniref:FAS1 domain-containing protein n=1 Tax=[Candida] jaroonii TaxID=467808 RepID=A0ACA9Y8C2_9ASCO|nr:FAS1 domain-containing protein [[Candida] jaroonii]